MPAKAKQYVDQGMTNVQNIVGSLQQAIDLSEKKENKAKIQSAIDSLNAACHQLSGFRD